MISPSRQPAAPCPPRPTWPLARVGRVWLVATGNLNPWAAACGMRGASSPHVPSLGGPGSHRTRRHNVMNKTGRGIPARETLSTVNRAGRMLLAKWLEGGRPQRPPRKRQRQDRALCVNRKSSQSKASRHASHAAAARATGRCVCACFHTVFPGSQRAIVVGGWGVARDMFSAGAS